MTAMIERELIERAKVLLPLPMLWQKLQWQGEPKKSCRVPYRADDARESGSVFQRQDGRWCFHDFKDGETFDEIGLLARIEGTAKGDALRRFLALAGVGSHALPPSTPAPSAPSSPRARNDSKPAQKPRLPSLRSPTREECQTIASVRGLDVEAVTLAACDNLLFIGERLGFASWVLTDDARWNAQFRRLDGLPYVLTDGREVKTLGIKGGWAAWPLGLPTLLAGNVQLAALVEGTPDALAAYQIIREAGLAAVSSVVCMTGAGLRIPAECLPAFAGKRVRIFCDADTSGRAAALRWEHQLRYSAATVDAFDLAGLLQADGKTVKDLNDACRMTANERASVGFMEGMA
jgi:hypothetical protein